MNPFRYLILVFVLSAIAIGGYAALVYTVDPYGFYRPNDRDLFPTKPAMTKNQNMAKANIIRITQPEAVIIGSSRADYAIDPTHSAFHDKHTYNAGIKGIRMAESKAMVIHAVESGAKHIIWTLDFFASNQNIKPRPDFKASRLYSNGKQNTFQPDWNTLISLSSLKPTLQTIRYRNRTDASSVQTNGQTTGADLDRKNAEKGMQKMFSDDALLYLSRLYFPTPHRSFKFAKSTSNAFADFEETLGYLKHNNIKTTLMIPPVHAQLLTLIYQSGLYPQYKMWKMSLLINAKKHGFVIHDFSALNVVTTETIPTQKDKTMQYWWEASHYKPVIGDAMITNVILNQPSSIAGFEGKIMTIDAINIFETNLIHYQCTHPTMVQSMRKAIIETGLENRLIPDLNCP